MTTQTVLVIAFILLVISTLNVMRKISKSKNFKVSITFDELEGELQNKINPSLAHFATEVTKAIQGSNVNYDELSIITIDRIRSYDYADVMSQSNYKRIYVTNEEEIETLLGKLKKETGMDLEELTSMDNWESEAQKTESVLLNEIAGAIDKLEFTKKEKIKGKY